MVFKKSFGVIPKFEELKLKLQTLKAKSPSAAKAISIEFANEAVKAGKNQGIIPRRTGNLRSTARVEIKDGGVYFITGGITGRPSRTGESSKYVNYAFYVNNGTSRQPPQFFMERSVSAASLMKNAFYRRVIKSWFAYIK